MAASASEALATAEGDLPGRARRAGAPGGRDRRRDAVHASRGRRYPIPGQARELHLGTIGAPYVDEGGGPGGWWILDEPELHLGEDIVVPDLTGWRRERMPELPDDGRTSPSRRTGRARCCRPSTRRLDLHAKRPVYAREGVASPVAH